MPEGERVSATEVVFRRVWADHYRDGSLFAKAFANDSEQPDRHSVSLASITSAEKLLALTETPERFIVVSLSVEEYQAMEQDVPLNPTDDDPGHCDVIGAKTARGRST